MEAATALALNSPSTPLANQVGGHQGVMVDASGSLVIKVRDMLFRDAQSWLDDLRFCRTVLQRYWHYNAGPVPGASP
jgi:hypothetical protein